MENASGCCLGSVTGEGQEWEPQVREEVAALVQARNDGGLWAEGHRSGDELVLFGTYLGNGIGFADSSDERSRSGKS